MDVRPRGKGLADKSCYPWTRQSLVIMCLLILWLSTSLQMLAFQYLEHNFSDDRHRVDESQTTDMVKPVVRDLLRNVPALPDSSPSSTFQKKLDGTRLEFDEESVAWESACILTISAWNNFGFVQSFFSNAKKTNPKLTCYVWLVADNPDPWNPDTRDMLENGIKPEIPDDWIVVTIADLQPLVDYNLAELALRYDLVCFNTAVKPLAFQWIFLETDAKIVMYFDNDIWIMQPLTTIIGLLESSSFVVTPHVLQPYKVDGRHQDERNIAQAGIMNYGFLGLSKSDATSVYLEWWAKRLRYYGYVDVAKGMHFDQNWSDFIPIFWDNDEYHVLQEPEFNIAYWNMHYTGSGITYDDSVVRLNGREVVFMHFSGVSDYRTYNLEEISKHQNRFTMSNFEGHLREVFEAYLDILDTNNCLRWRAVPYGFNHFENGVAVTDLMRKYYGEVSYFANEDPGSKLFRSTVHGNPFCVTMGNPACTFRAKDTSFWEWMLDTAHHFPLDPDLNFWVPELIYQLYRLRNDVQSAIPNPFGLNQHRLLDWAFGSGLEEHALSDPLLLSALEDKRKIAFAHKKKRAWGLNLFGSFSDSFQRGNIELMVYRCLVLSGTPTTVVQVPNLSTNSLQSKIESYSFQRELPFQREANNILNVFIIGPENIESFFNNYPTRKFRTHYNLAVVLWDWNTMPFTYVERLGMFTEVWTLSDFTSNALRNSRGWPGNTITSMKFLSKTVLPNIVLEPTVETQINRTEMLLQKQNIPAGAFIFLSIVHAYCEDKDNLIDTVSAFLKAFPSNEDVHYLIVVNPKHKYGISKIQLGELEEILEERPKIHLVAREISEAALDGVRTRADCYLSLHSSTGFNHEIFETFARGGIALTTDYGGHLDCIRSASFDLSDLLVGYSLVTKRIECQFMDGEAVIAKPHLDEAAAKIRNLWNNVNAVRKNVKEKLVPLASKCFGDASSNQFLNALELLHLKVNMFSRLLEH